jgi:hypothetical protein
MSNNSSLNELCDLFSKILIKLDNFPPQNSPHQTIQIQNENSLPSKQKTVHPRIRPPSPTKPPQKRMPKANIRQRMKIKKQMMKIKKRNRRHTFGRRICKPIPLNQIYFLSQ